MKFIFVKAYKQPLHKGAKVDDEDFELLRKYRWRENDEGYAARSSKGATYQMHRLIMRASRGVMIDHINNKPLDNRKANLRLCTNAQNQMNRGKQSNNTSGYKGVSWEKRQKKWRACIEVAGKAISIGYFKDKLQAHEAYKEAAKKYHGEFAKW